MSRLDYSTLSSLSTSDIQHTKYHCLCCCGISEQTTIKIDEKYLKIATENYNMCHCNTNSDTRVIKIDSIRSIQTSIGFPIIDPSPCQCMTVCARKYMCAPTIVRVNVDGLESRFHVHNKDAYMIHSWFTEPTKQEMI